jgi:AraC-like DNA-binding protein
MNGAIEKNKRLVMEAFDTLFNKRDYAAAEKFWSPDYIQHSALVEPGRDGLFNLVRTFPPGFRWESGGIMADGDLVMVHSRYLRPGAPRNLIGNDILRVKDGVFVEHWDLLQVCSHVARSYGPAGNVQESFKGGLAPWQRKRVQDLFRENLEGKLNLSALADECGLSVSHFARSFRRTFATSPHRYLILQRIAKAKELLTATSLSLVEVGLESGFSDQAAFSRTFKAVLGASPGKWQREVAHRRNAVAA